MNGAAIIAAVRTSTLVPTIMLSDSDLLEWINEGYYRAAAMHPGPWLEGSGQFATVADQQAYSLTTDIVDDVEAETPVAQSVRRIVAVYDDTRRTRLRPWDASAAVDAYGDEWPSSSHATAYFIWAGSLHLIPVPSESDVLYRVFMHKAPTPITLQSAPEFDSMFHPALVHYGEYRVWQREEDFEKATACYAHYLDMIDKMSGWYKARIGDAPWQIGVPSQPRGWTNTPFLDGLS